MMYVLIGLMLGSIIGVLVVSWKIINKYLGEELNKAVEKASRPKPELLLKPQQEPVK